MNKKIRRINEINEQEKNRFKKMMGFIIKITVGAFLLSLICGKNTSSLFKTICSSSGNDLLELLETQKNVIHYIRLPRTIAAFFIGSALAVSGLLYQSTFKNELVSPDILGVSSGCCFGAGIALLLGLGKVSVSILAFVGGAVAVGMALGLAKGFKNGSTLSLVLSGIIVSAFMNSFVSGMKLVADRNDKLSEITFWMMGSLSGTKLGELPLVILIDVACIVVIILIRWRIDIVSLGDEEARMAGEDYSKSRLIIIGCATLLTACSVAISGNVGWVGLVIPHIGRALAGSSFCKTVFVTIFCGGAFMMIADMLTRSLFVDEIPLGIITGLLGAVIYSAVLIKKGRSISE